MTETRTETGRDKSILFLCVANAARSQIAEGLARALFPEDWRIASAGSSPGSLDPRAVAVMQEIGIDISGQRSKSIDEISLVEYRWIITLCEDEVCPLVAGHFERRHWPLPDPAAAPEDALDGFRQARDAIRWRLEAEFPNQTRSQ